MWTIQTCKEELISKLVGIVSSSFYLNSTTFTCGNIPWNGTIFSLPYKCIKTIIGRGKIIHHCCDECQSHASRSSSLELSSCRGGKVLPPFDTLKIIVNLNIVHCLSPYSGTEYFMGWDEIDYLVLLSHSSKWHELTKWPHCPVTLQKAENGVMGETKGWIIYESTIHKH